MGGLSDVRRLDRAYHKLGVMPGLDPGIHDASPAKSLSTATAAPHHGLPGQARQ
jgi:hypothetical protein